MSNAVAPDSSVCHGGQSEQELDSGRRLAAAMFGIGKQQGRLMHRMSRAGIDKSAVILLKTLAAQGPLRSSALAAAVHSDPSTISRQIATLVRHGLVIRQADPEDGRASVLVPTEAGLDLLEEQRRRLGLVLARVVQDWEPEELTRFLELLERFVADHERALPEMINECAVARSEGEN